MLHVAKQHMLCTGRNILVYMCVTYMCVLSEKTQVYANMNNVCVQGSDPSHNTGKQYVVRASPHHPVEANKTLCAATCTKKSSCSRLSSSCRRLRLNRPPLTLTPLASTLDFECWLRTDACGFAHQHPFLRYVCSATSASKAARPAAVTAGGS